ncbi:MAG: DUF6531 domain-containing protein, partial [Candidatus Rifleibacteriota bacterium]
MYDPLNGSTFGAPNIPGYAAGFLHDGAVFGGAQNYLRYSVGTQIPTSGAIQFFIQTPGFQEAYQSNFIFTQPGYGGATRGDITLSIRGDNSLYFGQWPGYGHGWWNALRSPLPLNQWVKITAVYGVFGMYLYVDDQLMATDLSRRIPLSSRPFYFGTTRFWGPEVAFSGKLDEITTFASPLVKIMSPASGTVFMSDDEISFLGSGLGLNWYCQGVPIGSGNLVKTTLTPGEHTITVSGQDAIGGSGEDSITVVVQSSIEVTSISANPSTLWLDDSGAGSGIVFRATTSAISSVNFRIQTPSGSIIPIGVSSAIQDGSEYVAKLSWWDQSDLEEGTYTVIAEAGSSSKTSTFEVKHVAVSLVGLGKWMKNSKDPSAVLPPFAQAEVCPLVPWEEMLSLPQGYFSSLAVGDPVSTSSGNFNLPEVDFTIKDSRSFAIARIYNSLDPKISLFGRGWSSPLFVNLEIAENYVIFTNSDGSRLLFNIEGNNYTPASPTDLKLEFNPNTEFYTLSHPTGTNWIFNNNGQIVQMLRSCCGQGASDAIIFSYDSSGKLVSVATPSGKSITLAYNAENLITAITDSTGRIFNYSYDDDKNLVSFKDPLIRETTYSYDKFGFMTGYTKPGNKITEITYAENRVTKIKDPTGAQSSFNWDLENNKLTLTDFAGTVHAYNFDEDWRISSYAVPAINLNKTFTATNGRLTAQTDSLGHVNGYVYYENGFYSSHTDKLGNVTTFEWHPDLHKLTRKTDALGRKWSYEWCTRGNLIKKVDPAGNETTYTYDAHNNRTSKTDPLGHTTRYIYDSTGNYLLQTIDAMGGVSSFTYDARGNLLTSTDQLGRTTTFEYDNSNWLTKVVYPNADVVTYAYNAAGDRISE